MTHRVQRDYLMARAAYQAALAESNAAIAAELDNAENGTFEYEYRVEAIRERYQVHTRFGELMAAQNALLAWARQQPNICSRPELLQMFDCRLPSIRGKLIELCLTLAPA